MLEPFSIPDDFRAFMRDVATRLDDDAFQHECGHGGRAFGGASFTFTYLTADGQSRWELSLREQQILDIADGTITEIEGIRDDAVRTRRRTPRGPALVVWGEYRDDALRVPAAELGEVLELLHRGAATTPRMLRLWSRSDDQLVAIVHGDDVVLYVVESVGDYGTSVGDPQRAGGFAATDHEGQPIEVAWSECLAWDIARDALVHFAEYGELGDGFTLSGTLPTGLLMMGDFDRAAVVAARGEPPMAIAESSLTRLAAAGAAPGLAWTERFVELLVHHGLVAALADRAAHAAAIAALAPQVAAYGAHAIGDEGAATWLARELARVFGAAHATSHDVAAALAHTR